MISAGYGTSSVDGEATNGEWDGAAPSCNRCYMAKDTTLGLAFWGVTKRRPLKIKKNQSISSIYHTKLQPSLQFLPSFPILSLPSLPLYPSLLFPTSLITLTTAAPAAHQFFTPLSPIPCAHRLHHHNILWS
jgi:hypothetical protein